MIKSILVTGATGQLGQSLKKVASQYPDYEFEFVNRQQLDLNDVTKTHLFFEQQSFDLIINCAAYTAVDKAESEPEFADNINHIAVKQLAQIALKHNAKLIHISTDYVFNGQQCRPYVEQDEVEPQSVYGKSKLKGEQVINNIMKINAVTIRTSWLYSEFGNNFVKTMLSLGEKRTELNVIFDQVGTPTYAGDLASAIMKIVSSHRFNQDEFPSDIIHYSNEGVCSWYDFAQEIFTISNIHCNVNPIETKDYPTAATRPHYSLLNKSKIKHDFGLKIPYWKDSLQQCLSALQEK